MFMFGDIKIVFVAPLNLYHGPHWPRCNDYAHGCQDLFGSKMRFTRGAFGAMDGFGGAIPFQKMITPHFS